MSRSAEETGGLKLVLDLTREGSSRDNEPFRVVIDATAISVLIDNTDLAARVYELHAIKRLGDTWEYLWVDLEAVPESVAKRVAEVRKAHAPRWSSSRHPWPEGSMPFLEFDGLFYESYDEG